jgi:hypothetical protein
MLTVRPARAEDLDAMLDLYEAVATEGRWIGAEAVVMGLVLDGPTRTGRPRECCAS